MGFVSGCQLVTESIDPEAIRRSVENLSYGVVATVARQVTGSEPATYFTSEEVALLQMFAIAEEAASRWDANVAVVQRLGELLPGDSSFVCSVACTSEEAALSCCQFVLQHMAERVPLSIT